MSRTLPTDDLDQLVEQARERARRLRQGGAVDADIDERLAEEYAVVTSRPDPSAQARSALERLRASAPPGLAGISLPGRLPGAVAARKLAGRLLRAQLLGIAQQVKDVHSSTVEALAAIIDALSLDRGAMLAEIDALADRIAELERWAARPGHPAVAGGVTRLPASQLAELDEVRGLSLLVIDDDGGAEPDDIASAAHGCLRPGGRLVVHADRADRFRAAAERAGFVRAHIELLQGPEPLTRPADPRLAADLADLYDRVDELSAATGLERVVAVR